MIKDLRPRQPVVLYVENNPDDVTVFEMAMRKCHTAFALEVVGTLEDAERFLITSGAGHGWPPDLILLDYTLDHLRTGLQLLPWVHSRPETASIPVIVYCGDEFTSMVIDAYQKGAHGFLCKPPTFGDSAEIVQCLDECLSTTPPRFEPLLRLKMYRAPITVPLVKDKGPEGVRLH